MSETPPLRKDVSAVFRLEFASTRRLIHLLPDELARKVPDHPLFSYPRTANPQDGFIDISSKRFANAINRVSWYLADRLGPPRNFETVAYIGPNDIRYFLFMFGAMKVGYKMLFLSPRNNLEGHLNVLQGVGCQIFLKARDVDVSSILSKRAMRTSVVSELEELLDENPVEVYPYMKSFEQAQMDPCLVLHTTGSTGLPKPITWKVGILSTYEAWRTIPHVDDYVPTTEIYQQSKRAYTSMPLFHTSGINAGITWSLLCGVTLVFGAPHVVPSASYADAMHAFAGVDASMGAPSIYEELSRDSESLQRINKLHYVVASGAPLSQAAGNLISKHTRVICNLGATETACLQRLAPAIDDWAYFYWHPTHSGIEMREAVDGLYELFLVKNPDLKLFQGIFNTFPDIQEWSMNDLYSRHPDPAKPFLYKYRGRKDDVIVLSNGEKVAPALMEATLMSHPLVRGAMVVGKGKFQPAVVVDLAREPPKTPMERHRIVEELLPVIAEANVHAPAHGKLDQYHILFADPKKPIVYLGQGKIQRHKTFTKYEKDIEQLYKSVDDVSEDFAFSQLPSVDLHADASVTHWLNILLAHVTGITQMSEDQDFFEAGIDSLQVIKMARELRIQASRANMGRDCLEKFQASAIYKHPTLNRLRFFILRQAGARSVSSRRYSGTIINGQNNGLTNGAVVNNLRKSMPEHMRGLLHSHVRTLPRSNQSMRIAPIDRMTVVLTGSTGSLGSYLLDTLHQNKHVSRIICLNRSSNAAERHKQMCQKRGLSPLNPDRVEFIKADLSRPKLGVDPALYESMRSTATHIIHNQWPVNFNWVLSSFEPYVQGVRNLIDFSHSSSHNAFLLFVSSVSAVGSWKARIPVPEQPIYDLSVASKMGYGQSKLISECLLDQAAQISGVNSACCRVGIVAGPVEQRAGVWNRQEYIPSIFISSAALHAFPSTFPSRDRVDWLPVDKLSKILVEILLTSSSPLQHLQTSRRGTQMYHVVNPRTTSWTALAPKILSFYPEAFDMAAVPFEQWIEVLEKSVDESVPMDPERNPAVKLLGFYREAAKQGKRGERARVLERSKAEAASRTLQRVEKVDEEWVRAWMQQWGIVDG